MDTKTTDKSRVGQVVQTKHSGRDGMLRGRVLEVCQDPDRGYAIVWFGGIGVGTGWFDRDLDFVQD